ncbi:hypothetical protein DCO48_05560 [Pseudomonas sp. SDI]|uniref:hypothetical protein n=1 Tax=Pseudomonas sp. SDI TaxID=2170734 RepID=UPI000DE6A373|nr:hypothetical protein [Pseudomonas sp. SDI]PWB34610.1 hypothetical protein DCO48_05560 [Pseudomonas sp. SDI]
MLAWIKMLRSQPLALQLRILRWFGVIMAVMTLIPVLCWQSPPTPAANTGVTLLGKVTGGPSEWKTDRSMVSFTIKYPLPGKRLYHTSGIYTFKSNYAASGIALHSPVYVTIDEGTERPVVREVFTPQGYVLHTPAIKAHTVAVSNQHGLMMAIVLVCLSLASFISSGVVWLRQRKPQTA